MDLARHKTLVRKQFAIQARAFPETVKLRRSENVVPMIELARPAPTDRLLDVASGSGFVVQAFAPRVRSAVGVDLAEEMVELARRVTAEKGIENAEFQSGDAEDLEFEPGTFEIVACRFTFHHFARPERALSEMRRVLAPGGRIVLYDFLAAAGKRTGEVHNRIERARDASHVRIYASREFEALFRKCRLSTKERVVTLWKRDFDHWMRIVDAGEARRARVRRLLEGSIPGNKAGLGARVRDGRLTFTHTCVAWLLTPRR